MRRLSLKTFILGGALALAPAAARAEDLLRTLTGQEPSQVGTPLRLLALVTVFSLAPSIILLTTSFPRIVIVLSFLRRAIGTADLPPNSVVVGLSIFLTAAIMMPTWQEVHREAVVPYMDGRLPESQALERAAAPVKRFMLERTARRELRLFIEISRYEDQMEARGSSAEEESVSDLPLTVVIPAFLLTELKVAFQMGFLLFLPFLIIDLIVSTSLVSMGMILMPPVLVSLPLKVLVFVLVDGWNLIVGEMVKSFW